ncbi:hypothetical protein CQA53_06160 [Helicobacter didelphidarum]|uniref:Uncharacterized protein n=1 Tax=Helicobacter didelphidarum TaxID=2040648 RepID=A0A3D8IKF1_9HELI|nr:hypothetical protein [Helicobacter didelphidarum]RDU65356.1 hypothetical protein CQA53_06160 [Helicobacter didelphidarum]
MRIQINTCVKNIQFSIILLFDIYSYWSFINKRFLSKIVLLICMCNPYIHAVTQDTQEITKQEVVKDNNQPLTVIQKEEFDDIFTTIDNPIFMNLKPYLGAGYYNILGLGDTQTLSFNGGYIEAMYPLKHKNITTNFFSSMSFGSANNTSQNAAIIQTYIGLLGGVEVNIPFSTSGVVAHGVFGVDVGVGFLLSKTMNVIADTFFGVDFIYQRFAFRPFVGINTYVSFGQGIGLNLHMGLKIFYHFNNARSFLSVMVTRDFIRNGDATFTILPNYRAAYFGPIATSFEFNAGVDLFSVKHLLIRGVINALYTSNYYNVNVGVNAFMSYRF